MPMPQERIQRRTSAARAGAVAEVARNADALPDEKQPHRQHLQLEEGTPPQRHGAAMPCGPIDEEQDVAAFFEGVELDGLAQGLVRVAAKANRSFGQQGDGRAHGIPPPPHMSAPAPARATGAGSTKSPNPPSRNEELRQAATMSGAMSASNSSR